MITLGEFVQQHAFAIAAVLWAAYVVVVAVQSRREAAADQAAIEAALAPEVLARLHAARAARRSGGSQ